MFFPGLPAAVAPSPKGSASAPHLDGGGEAKSGQGTVACAFRCCLFVVSAVSTVFLAAFAALTDFCCFSLFL
jgi:hypothetical protein